MHAWYRHFRKKEEIQQKIDTIYTPHGVVLRFGCYLHFLFNIQPSIKRKMYGKKFIF